MKKLNKILCVLLALAMVFALVACGGSGDTAGTEAQGETGSAAAAVDYKIGIITGTVSQGEEESQAAPNMTAKYGDMIVTATYPDNFSTETEQTIATVTNMAADPDVKAMCTVTVEAASSGGGGGGGGSTPSYSDHTEIDASEITKDEANTKIYPVDKDTLVTLTGLTPGEVYTICPQSSSSPAAKATSITSAPKASPSSDLITTNGGTYIIYADSDTVQFGGDELGDGTSSFKLAELEPEPIDIGDNMIIQSNSDKPLFVNGEGQKVYEKVYEVDLSKASELELTLSDIVVYTVRSGR